MTNIQKSPTYLESTHKEVIIVMVLLWLWVGPVVFFVGRWVEFVIKISKSHPQILSPPTGFCFIAADKTIMNSQIEVLEMN